LKKILRKKLLNIRKRKYLEINSKHISNIFELIKSKYKKVKVIGGYIPVNYEYDCSKLLKFLETKNYTISLPVIKKNFDMDFYKYSFLEPQRVNKLGIIEPIKSSKKILPDLIFVPLLGYDNNLNRLGYGGGFYDRYFQKTLILKNS